MSRGPVYGALTVSCAFRTLHACDDYLISEHFHTSTSSRQRWTCKAVTHCTAVCIRLSQGQLRSKALVDPDSTVTWGAFSCFGPKGWSWKPEVLRAGMGLWGGPATGPRERCKLPQWGPPAAKGFGTFHVLKWPLLLLETLCVLCVSFHTFFVFFVAPLGAPRSSGPRFNEPSEPPGVYATAQGTKCNIVRNVDQFKASWTLVNKCMQSLQWKRRL